MSKQYVKYSPDIIKLIDSLVNKGNLGIKLEKNDDGTRISCNYKSASYLFHVDFPVENFEFSGEEINFYDFGEFANIMKTFKYPNIVDGDAVLTLDMDTSSVDYTIGDPDAIKRGFTKERSFESDLHFKMSAESIKTLNSVKSLFGSEYLSFVYDGNTLKARLTSKTRGDNKYEEFYTVDDGKDVTVDFKMFALVTSALTIGDWVVDVCNDGIVRFTYQNTSDINLNLYCMRVDDE